MQKKSKCLLSLLLGLCLAFTLSIGETAFAAEKIMPVQEIKAGMQGIGKTVIEGTKIVPFAVKVLGIVPGQGNKGDLILVRVGGAAIEKAGGIAQGMSGSPVYINGKLIGAIGYGWEMADHNLGLVTPIEDMLKVLALKNKEDVNKPLLVDGKMAGEKEKMLFQPLKTPLLVNGIEGRALERLKNKLKTYDIQVVKGAGQGQINLASDKLEPGSAMGVQMTRGYVESGAIGTVTYVDGNKILAFGHPFMNKGFINMPLTTAYIHQTIPSMLSSFKLGSTGKVVGAITQDRTAGIGGEIGSKTPMTLVRMHVTDKDLGKTERMYFEVIKDRDLTSALIISGLLGMLDSSLDRIGKGTAKVSWEIKGAGLPDGKVQRENMFFSPNDISAMSLLEIGEFLDMSVSNVYKDVDLKEMLVKVEIEEKDKTAYIQKAEAKQNEVKAGDTTEIAVTYLPYRSEPITSVVKVKIPADTPAGMLNLSVSSGVMPVLLGAKQESPDNNLELLQQTNLPFNSLEEMLDVFLDINKNNEIVIEQMAGDNEKATVVEAIKQQSKEGQLAAEERTDLTKISLQGKGEDDKKIKATLATDYVLQGIATVNLKVLPKK